MSASARYSVRLVVQHIQESRRSFFRLVAYGDGATFLPAEFSSAHSLWEALSGVFPGLDQDSISIRHDAQESYIAFTREAELDHRQLRLLGLYL